MSARAADLQALLARHRDELIGTEFDRLRGSGLPHYMSLGQERLRERCTALVDEFLAALGGQPTRLGDHIEHITRERIGEGYFLDEIQRALSFLEERSWEIVAAESPPADLVPRLAAVTQTIGAAKDRLARVYLDLKLRAESRAEVLEGRLRQLFGGTDPGPVGETG